MIHNYYNTKHMCFVGHVGRVWYAMRAGGFPLETYKSMNTKMWINDISGYIRVYEQIGYIVNVTANSKIT